MSYKTINVKSTTYSRLVLYKHAGMSFDDVLNEMMDTLPEEKFYERVLEEHRSRMKEISAGEVAESQNLDVALNEV